MAQEAFIYDAIRTPRGKGKAGGSLYEVKPIDLRGLEQKQPWFVQMNPNGRIPVIVDEGFPVFESGAILVYLADKAGELMPLDRRGRSRAMQWLMFQMGGGGPMMGQANVFNRYAPEKNDWAIGRYQRECRRLLEVLDGQLGRSRYLTGDTYTIADIANWCWTHTREWSGVDGSGLENLARWEAELRARPAVMAGKAVPQRVKVSDAAAEVVAPSVRGMLV